MIPNKALYKIIEDFFPTSTVMYKYEYSTRLKVQKLIYMYGELRGKDKYDFSWYLAGPYSSTLTHQIYGSLLDEIPQKSQEWDDLRFSAPVAEELMQLHGLIDDAKKLETMLNETQLFELMGSILYLYKSMPYIHGDPQILKEKLIANKRQFANTPNLDSMIELILTVYRAQE